MESCKLDLHGVKHQAVDALVENFVLMNQNSFPLTVVCGNSVKMVELAEAVINRIGCEYTMYRFGVITIGRFK
jgi:orotate phosphoribosyltransferase-like protein